MEFAVAKFGGTSLGDASIIKKSAAVLDRFPAIRLVVISATAGSTNQLLSMARFSVEDSPNGWTKSQELYDVFKERHLKIAHDLNVTPESLAQIHACLSRTKDILQGMKLLKDASPLSLDELASQGELIASVLFYEAVKATHKPTKWLDARQLMKTTSDFGNAKPFLDLLKEESEKEIVPLLETHIVVTQGYIGSDLNQKTTTLGKEGSDYSTALFAEALKASEIQIWKDVPGIMTTDPRVVSDAYTLPEISFAEASELTRFGAKVIHPDTFLPALRQKIPLRVGYSQNPELPGTRIVALPTDGHKGIRAIALKREQKLLLVEDQANSGTDYAQKVFTLLNQYKIHSSLFSLSNYRLAILLDGNKNLPVDLVRELESFAHFKVEEDLEMIALIGLWNEATIDGTILEFFKNTPPLLYGKGASDYSFCLVVKKGHSEKIVQALHQYFLAKK